MDTSTLVKVAKEIRTIERALARIRRLTGLEAVEIKAVPEVPEGYPSFPGMDEAGFVAEVYKRYGLNTRMVNILIHKYGGRKPPIWPQDLWEMTDNAIYMIDRGVGEYTLGIIRRTIIENPFSDEQRNYLHAARLYFHPNTEG